MSGRWGCTDCSFHCDGRAPRRSRTRRLFEELPMIRENKMIARRLRIGVYICHCGMNIAKQVEVETVTEFASQLPGVVLARNYKFMCSDPGQEVIQQDIRDSALDGV